MCDVTRDNFEDLLPNIRKKISTCSFIAFDTEFTALTVGNENRSSLFDSMEDRYQKLRSSAAQSIINQVGLSIFHSDVNSNTYTASTYNFYVCPRSFGPLDDVFVFKASSLEFFCQHNFDFNKFIHKGIGYLNSEQESVLTRYLQEGNFFRATERNVSFRDEDFIKDVCSRLAQWLQGRQAGEETTVECGQLPTYVMHLEVRAKFPGLWSFARKREEENGRTKTAAANGGGGGGDDGGGRKRKITVKVVSEQERKQLSEDSSQDLSSELLDHMRGLSHVVREVIRARKPIVGHNCFTDLLKIFHQFVSPLPPTYLRFKQEITRIFPSVYDTKHLSFALKRQLEVEGSRTSAAFVSTNLEELFKTLSTKNSNFDLMFGPKIVHNVVEEFTKRYDENECFHEAGYDAFATGYCFLKAAHIAASVNYLAAHNMKPLNFLEHLRSLEEFRNQINIGRGVISYVNLYGPDPEVSRPEWLLVRSKRKNSLDHFLIAEQLARFGSVDVRQYSRNEVLVAVGTFGAARDITAALRDHPELTVVKFSPFRHGRTTRALCRYASAAFVSLVIISSTVYIVRKRM